MGTYEEMSIYLYFEHSSCILLYIVQCGNVAVFYERSVGCAYCADVTLDNNKHKVYVTMTAKHRVRPPAGRTYRWGHHFILASARRKPAEQSIAVFAVRLLSSIILLALTVGSASARRRRFVPIAGAQGVSVPPCLYSTWVVSSTTTSSL